MGIAGTTTSGRPLVAVPDALDGPLLRWVLADGAVLRLRRAGLVVTALAAVAVALLVDLPLIRGLPAPAVAPPVVAVLAGIGGVDARLGLLATVVLGVVGAGARQLTGLDVLGTLAILGHGVVLLMPAVAAPLVARSLAAAMVARIRSRMGRSDAPAWRTDGGAQRVAREAIGALLAGLLVLMWFGGATVFVASMTPGAGVLDVGPVDGAALAAGAVVLGSLLRIPLAGRVVGTADPLGGDAPPRPPSRTRRILNGAGATGLLLALVSSLFVADEVRLAWVAVLLVAIRLVREGVAPEPVRLLGPRARARLHRMRDATSFLLVAAVAAVIAAVAGTDIARVRTGYLVLLAVILAITRGPARPDEAAPARPGTGRRSQRVAAASALAAVALLLVAPQPQAVAADEIPGLVGASSTVAYDLTHSYPPRLFVPRGQEPESDDWVDRTTSYVISVDVREATVLADGRLSLGVELSGRMASWEGGDCTSAPFEVQVVIADSPSSLDRYFSAYYSDPSALATGGWLAPNIPFISRMVRVPCGAFSVAADQLVDVQGRSMTAAQGLVVAYHPRALDGDVSAGDPPMLPVEQDLTWTATPLDLTIVPAAPAAPTVDGEVDGAEVAESAPAGPLPAPTDDAAGGGAEAVGPSADGEGGGEGGDGAEAGTGGATAVAAGEDAGDVTAAAAPVEGTAVDEVRFIPTPSASLPIPPPLLGLVAPVALAGLAGAAASAAAAGTAGAALGAAGGAAGGAASGAAGTGPSSLIQGSDGATLGGQDLRPIVGLPDVDLERIGEDEPDD